MIKRKGKPQQPAESKMYFYMKQNLPQTSRLFIYVEHFTMYHVPFGVKVVFLKILSPQLGAHGQGNDM